MVFRYGVFVAISGFYMAGVGRITDVAGMSRLYLDGTRYGMDHVLLTSFLMLFYLTFRCISIYSMRPGKSVDLLLPRLVDNPGTICLALLEKRHILPLGHVGRIRPSTGLAGE